MNELLRHFHELDPDVRTALLQGITIVLIVVGAGVANAVAEHLIRRLRALLERRRHPSQAARVQTLGRVCRYVAAVVIWLVAGMLVLGELGISVAPVLATAGVAGVAVGFGAQSLIKDYLSGFFLLLEDQVRQGDVVEVAGQSGLVEEVTLRFVRLRNFDGHVYFVPNGEISIVKNLTRDYAQVVVDAGVAYREDVDQALEVMCEVGKRMREDPVFGPSMVDEPELVGVERWADSAVVLRCRLKVIPPIQQWNVRREFLRRLKRAYDERGIEIPFPHLTVYAGQAKDGGAPAFRIAG
jgi:small conductance mechanosensitive channel